MQRSTRAFLQVVGAASSGVLPAVYSFFEAGRFVFNPGEGFQRLAFEYKVRLIQLRGVFLTRLTGDVSGGLPGLYLTLSDAGLRSLALFGPPGVDRLLDAPFLRRTQTPVCASVATAESPIDASLDAFHVHGYLIAPKKRKHDTHALEPVVVYVCDTHPVRGKFLVDRATALGVPKGAAWGKLSNGVEVTLEDGRVIQAKDVLGDPMPPLRFVIVDCPHLAYLEPVAALPQLEHAHAMIHYAPSEVVQSERYRRWIDTMPQCEHIFLGIPADPIPLAKSNAYYSSLSALHPALLSPLPTPRLLDDPRAGRHGLEYTLTPSHQGSRLVSPPRHDTEAAVDAPQMCCWSPTNRFRVTFLGTGAAMPSPRRNVSGVLLEMECGNMLLDCGEGSYTQLIRKFGTLPPIAVIWVSHPHADHHCGIPLMVAQLNAYNITPRIIAPACVLEWVTAVLPHATFQTDVLTPFLLLDLGPELQHTTIHSVPVFHCEESYGAVVKSNGATVVYSGDAVPTPKLIDVGRDADLLIHEATFEDGFEEEAKGKMHSTVGQAKQVGSDMGAKATVLTHFSQRVEEPIESVYLGSHVWRAVDLMSLCESDLL